MKRLLGGLLLLWLLLAAKTPLASAQIAPDTKAINTEMMPSYNGGGSLPFGQEDYYSVTLRGNGEAVVTGKFVFTNNENAVQSMFSLRLPRVRPQDISAFQIIKEPVCIRYAPKPLEKPLIQIMPGYPGPENCLEYRPISWNEYSYGPAKYQKAKTKLDADTLIVFLPNPIKPNDSGSIILYYRGLGYAKKNLWGAYEATFETPKMTDSVNKLVVGVTVDDDLKLAGAKGQVSYRFSDSWMTPAAKMAEGVAASNQFLDSYIYQIGQGQIVKTATNLAALDSYIVRARYADNLWSLYAKELLVGFLIGLVSLAGLGLLLRWFVTKLRGSTKSSASRQGIEIVATIGLPLLASLGAVTFTILLFFCQRLLGQFIPYDFRFFIIIFSLLVSSGVYLLLLLAPAVYIGMKKRIGWGLTAFGLTILWLVIFGAITLVALWFTAATQRDYPVLMKSMMDSAVENPQ